MSEEKLTTYCFTCGTQQEEEEGTLFYNPRGIGNNWIPCFVCGKENENGKCQKDMAAFVRGKEQGEKIVALFVSIKLYATLDFRPSEPDWIQVKVGACKDHEPNLMLLYLLTAPRHRISQKILLQVGGKS
jgi:hypothetical protein